MSLKHRIITLERKRPRRLSFDAIVEIGARSARGRGMPSDSVFEMVVSELSDEELETLWAEVSTTGLKSIIETEFAAELLPTRA